MDNSFLLTGQGLTLQFGPYTFLLYGVAVGFGLPLELRFFNASQLEHLHGARHRADFVFALGSRDLGRKVTACQAPHQGRKGDQRLGYPCTDGEEAATHDERQSAQDCHIGQGNCVQRSGGESLALGDDGILSATGHRAEFCGQRRKTRCAIFQVKGVRCGHCSDVGGLGARLDRGGAGDIDKLQDTLFDGVSDGGRGRRGLRCEVHVHDELIKGGV